MNKRNLIILLIAALVLGACGFFSSDNPCDRYMERRKMANLVTEIFLLETYLSNQHNVRAARDSVAYYYSGLFDKYEVSRKEFEKAFECYLLDNQQMNWLIDEVLSILSISKSRVDEKKEELDEERMRQQQALPRSTDPT